MLNLSKDYIPPLPQGALLGLWILDTYEQCVSENPYPLWLKDIPFVGEHICCQLYHFWVLKYEKGNLNTIIS